MEEAVCACLLGRQSSKNDSTFALIFSFVGIVLLFTDVVRYYDCIQLQTQV